MDFLLARRLPATGAAACYFWARPFVEQIMNEQLVVKNFGPIKDATVDFKRVTVFIGPTGGGKSTLAKLAAIMKTKDSFKEGEQISMNLDSFKKYAINNFFSEATYFHYKNNRGNAKYENEKSDLWIELTQERADYANNIMDRFNIQLNQLKYIRSEIDAINDILAKSPEKVNTTDFKERIAQLSAKQNEIISTQEDLGKGTEYTSSWIPNELASSICEYIPSERIFLSVLEYSWAGLLRDDIGLPKILLDFANNFSLARKEIHELEILFFNAKYLHINGRDFIKIPDREEPLMLSEAASSIQSVTPLLVLLEHLSRNTEQAQSFIIEGPELNLYPTAQRDLVYTLLEKCTQGKNDLTITTHSPYVLSALNLALYANKVAAMFPHQSKKVAKLIPEKYWLKAEEFSAYFVAKGGAKSIFDTKTGLLSESQLDELSGEFADVFDRLTDLRVPEKKAVAKAKPAKK